MNFFKSIWTAILNFFRSPSGKKIIKHATEILKEVAGKLAKPLAERALEAVKRAEREGGDDKYERAFKEIAGFFSAYELEKLGEQAINLAIENTLAAIRKEVAENGPGVLYK